MLDLSLVGLLMNENSENKERDLSKLKLDIQQMQRDITHGAKKPHKLVMLLAVIDLFDKGKLTENKIYFNTDLVESFANVFNLIRARGDWNQPAPPFSIFEHRISGIIK